MFRHLKSHPSEVNWPYKEKIYNHTCNSVFYLCNLVWAQGGLTGAETCSCY